MTDCLKWKGRHRKEDRRPMDGDRYAYHTTYEAKYGPLEPGQILHHGCHNSWCINPDHLQPMTQGEHLRLHGLPGDWGQARKTHCPAGHPYDEANTYHWRNERQCRTCRLATQRRHRAKKRSQP